MSITAPVYDKSDARSEKLYPFHLPLAPEWAEQSDYFSQSSMMGSGAGMFLKNPLIVWGSMISAVIGFVNQQPLRTSKDATSPLIMLGMALTGVLALNAPKFILAPETQAPVMPVP